MRKYVERDDFLMKECNLYYNITIIITCDKDLFLCILKLSLDWPFLWLTYMDVYSLGIFDIFKETVQNIHDRNKQIKSNKT
jgi:hypothetical protein